MARRLGRARRATPILPRSICGLGERVGGLGHRPLSPGTVQQWRQTHQQLRPRERASLLPSGSKTLRRSLLASCSKSLVYHKKKCKQKANRYHLLSRICDADGRNGIGWYRAVPPVWMATRTSRSLGWTPILLPTPPRRPPGLLARSGGEPRSAASLYGELAPGEPIVPPTTGTSR